MFKSSLRPKIEKILGHSVPDDEKHTIDDLRSTSPTILAELKKLAQVDEYLAILYLKYLATKANEEEVHGFVFDVTMGKYTATDWRKDILLVCSYTFTELAAMDSVQEILKPIEPYCSNGAFFQIEFNMDFFEKKINRNAAPCVRVLNHDYRNLIPKGIIEYKTDMLRIHPVKSPEIAALRWLTSYIARMIWDYLTNSQRTESDLLDLIQKCSPDTELKNAIRTAVRALTEEMKLIGGIYTEKDPPGFIISDEYLKTYLEKLPAS